MVLPAAAYPGFALGLVLFTGILTWHGVGDVARALTVGGLGLLAVPVFHLLPLAADALGWRCLLPRRRPAWASMLFARWVGESVNGLLPVLQIGGNVAKARVLARRGVPGVAAGASVVVDVTLVMLSQVGFTLLGVALLVGQLGGHRLLPGAVVGLALTAALLGGFVLAQRGGLFASGARLLGWLTRRGRDTGLVGDAVALDAEVAALYRRRRALASAFAWHVVSWVVGVGEVWIALAVLGHPVDLRGALLLESLGQAVRAAAFAVPGALGVQEGSYLLLGAAVGLAPETALAVSLTKRLRDLTLGLPGLLAWQLDARRTTA